MVGERLKYLTSHDSLALLHNSLAIPKLQYLLRTVGQPLQVTRSEPWKPDSEHGNQNTASLSVEHLNIILSFVSPHPHIGRQPETI